MNNAPKNLTQLKRFIKPGMVLTRTHSKMQPEPHPAPVKRVQGNAFTILHVRQSDGKEIESWHNYQKADAYTFDDAGFSVSLGDNYGVARYEYPSDA